MAIQDLLVRVAQRTGPPAPADRLWQISSVDRVSLASLVSQPSPAANSIGEWRRRTGAESGGILTLDIIYYFLTADTAGEYFQLVRGGVAALGIDHADAENWIDSVKARPEEKHEYVLSPGFKPGFAVSYDLRYDGSKATQVIIVSVSAS